MKNLALVFLALLPSGQAIARSHGGKLNNLYFSANEGPYPDCFVGTQGLSCAKPGPHAGKFPTDLSAFKHFCAVIEGKVECWGGSNRSGEAFSPDFGPARAVFAGQEHSCALGEFGVRCWGNNLVGQLNVPPLKDPFALAGSLNSTCALDQEGAKCWGPLGKFPGPALRNPRLITVGLGDSSKPYACALDVDGPHCWGDPKLKLNLKLPADVIWMKAYYSTVCTLRPGSKIDCVNIADGKLTAPSIDDNRLVFLHNEFCFYSEKEDALTCPLSGLNRKDVSAKYFFHYAKLADPRFDLDDFTGFLNVLSQTGGGGRAALAGKIISGSRDLLLPDLTREAALNRYLLVTLIAPAVLSSDSTYGQKQLIPAFFESVKGFENELVIRGFLDVKWSSASAKRAWLVAQAALSTLNSFLKPEDKAKTQGALRSIGQAWNDPGNKNLRQRAIEEIQAAWPTIEKAKGSNKSAFLVETLANALQWQTKAGESND